MTFWVDGNKSLFLCDVISDVFQIRFWGSEFLNTLGVVRKLRHAKGSFINQIHQKMGFLIPLPYILLAHIP
jgi:hypothetical protein